jgi:hypothetical protein
MKKLIAGVVFTMALALSAVSLYAQQSVWGKWIMSVQGMSLNLEMIQNGEKISGTLDSPHGVIPLTGEFSNGKLSLFGAPTESHPRQVVGTATLKADGSLAGSVSVNQMEMSFTAVRAAGN